MILADLVRHASLNYNPADDVFNGLLLFFVSAFLQRHCVLGVVLLWRERRTRLSVRHWRGMLGEYDQEGH